MFMSSGSLSTSSVTMCVWPRSVAQCRSVSPPGSRALVSGGARSRSLSMFPSYTKQVITSLFCYSALRFRQVSMKSYG